MPVRSAKAQWDGTLKEGKGTMSLGSGAFQGAYSFNSRFESGTGTNPEELVGAAHAGCFSMALSAQLSEAGLMPKRIETAATVTLEKVADGFAVTAIHLDVNAIVPGADEAKFQAAANKAKEGCPISKLLNTEITMQ